MMELILRYQMRFQFEFKRGTPQFRHQVWIIDMISMMKPYIRDPIQVYMKKKL